ncbi:MAG: hypothetical protein SR1Q7_11080 [Quinella sp. 1Q7]|nr:hypothetical protein [Quinella sp. 1Q7]
MLIRKIFFMCLTLLLGLQGAAAAKDAKLPEAERIKVAVEITNSSRYKELPTAHHLENFLGDKLTEKNLLNVVDMQVADESVAIDRAADTPSPAENIGELLIFEAVELPSNNEPAANFNPDVYKALGADYVVRCEVLGLGVTKVDDKTIGTVTKVIGSGMSFAGNSSSERDKTLRRVGTVLGLGGFIDIKRTALNTVVNMKFISVETGAVLWQANFVGKAIKHHAPREGYVNAWEQAYVESVEDSAKLIAKRVNKYVDRVIIQGKSDKSFQPKKFSFGGLGGFLSF